MRYLYRCPTHGVVGTLVIGETVDLGIELSPSGDADLARLAPKAKATCGVSVPWAGTCGRELETVEAPDPADPPPGAPRLSTLPDDAWRCEQHPALPWPHDDCAGPGELKPDWQAWLDARTS